VVGTDRPWITDGNSACWGRFGRFSKFSYDKLPEETAAIIAVNMRIFFEQFRENNGSYPIAVDILGAQQSRLAGGQQLRTYQ
jgi:hypothetical protein